MELLVWLGSLTARPDERKTKRHPWQGYPVPVFPSSGCFLGAITQIIGRSRPLRNVTISCLGNCARSFAEQSPEYSSRAYVIYSISPAIMRGHRSRYLPVIDGKAEQTYMHTCSRISMPVNVHSTGILLRTRPSCILKIIGRSWQLSTFRFYAGCVLIIPAAFGNE